MSDKIIQMGHIEILGNGWKLMSEKVPEEPHRDVQVLSIDAAGQVFCHLISSYIAGICNIVMWREITPQKDNSNANTSSQHE